MLLQVHDELVFETPENGVDEEAAMVREEMVRAGEPMKTFTAPSRAKCSACR